MPHLYKLFSSLILGLVFCIHLCYGGLPSQTVYLTWKSHPDTTMVIQWVSEQKEKSSLIYFRQVLDHKNMWWEVTGYSEAFPNLSNLLLHQVELKNLQPNTLYEFKLANDDFPTARYFQTMPRDLKDGIRFVVGGDMYHDNHGTELMKKTCRQSVQTNPHFVVLGGDIAYAFSNSLSKEKPERWIDWLKAWNSCMVTSDNRIIPVIAAIGNHDVQGHYNKTPKEAKVYCSLFPTTNKQTYGVLDFSDYLSLFILDSGHANSIQGNQAKWLEDALKMRQNSFYKFAVYHVPAYPSVRSFNNFQSVSIRRHWVPLFEKWGIEMAFEHHDHAYKRTFPLLKDKPDPNGIIYMGDGAWSVDKTRQPLSSKKIPYLAKFASVRHFILMTLKEDNKRVQSISESGQIVDEFVIENKILENAISS